MKHAKGLKRLVACAGVLAMFLGVTACGGSKQSSGDENVELNVWAWEPTLKAATKEFEKKYPNIKIKLQNAGTAKEQYTALDNAIQAGKGAPDVAQIELYALSQYAINDRLTDLSDRTKGYSKFYNPGTWNSVLVNKKPYGLPFGSGAMAFFYNKDVFDKAGVDATQIKTWDQYYEAAKKIRAVGSYIAADSGDAGFFDAMIWQANGHPYKLSADGKDLSINLDSDKGTQSFIKWWQKMIDEDLVDTKTVIWTEDWNKSLNNGKLASALIGCWIPTTLVNVAPDQAGKWRVTTMPTQDGSAVNSNHGGSSLAIMASSKKTDAAYKYIDFISRNQASIDARVAGGSFPDDVKTTESKKFKEATTVKNTKGDDIEYFGGQKYNEVLAKAASDVIPGHATLPFEVYARTVFADDVGSAYTDKKITLKQGVDAWQKHLKEYGKQQGFNVH